MIQDQRTVKAKNFYQTQSSQNDVTLFLRETLCLNPLNATLKQTFKLVSNSFVTLTQDFTSITYHVFKFSFKLFVRPSNFEERYKIYIEITIIGTYIKL